MLAALGRVTAVLTLTATVFTGHPAPDETPRAAGPEPLTAAAEETAATARVGAPVRLNATAYCHAGTTASGTRTRTGIVAADPRVLPVGSIVRIIEPGAYAGIYTVMDTGSGVKGHHLDIFMPNCVRAQAFGRRSVRVRVIRRGWDPKASADGGR